MERRDWEARNMEGLNRNKNKKQRSTAGAVATAFEKLKKTRKQPIRVVYISNPMKVKTTVTQFRSVVQGLTGLDSDLDASLSRYGDGAATTWVPPQSLVPPVEDRCCGSADRDLNGDAYAKQVAVRELDQFDDAKFPEFLLHGAADLPWHELQGHVHFSH